MNPVQLCAHARRITWREFIAGEYWLTLFALIVGVTAVTSIGLVSSRIEQAMFARSADMIGGDQVLRSTEWPDQRLIDYAAQAGLDASLSVSTSTMAGAGEGYVLSSARAVDEYYPLKGQLTVRDGPGEKAYETDGPPAPGNAWAESRLLRRLGIEVGDTVDIGYTRLKITRILELEPDRGAEFYSLNPRVLFNMADLADSRLVQPASRIRYRLMLAGNAEGLDTWNRLSAPLLQSNQRLVTPGTSRTRVAKNLERASIFINLGGLMSIILCSIAVALSASRHANRHIGQAALLRCFGLRGSQINAIYCIQLLLIALPAIVAGTAAGYAVHLVLVGLVEEFFNSDLPAAGAAAWLGGPVTALCMMAGFGLPSVLRLARTPPARILRREMNTGGYPRLTGSLAAFCALLAIAGWQSGSLRLAIFSVCGIATVLACLLLMVAAMVKLIHSRGIRQPLLRVAFASLASRPLLSAMQIAGFGLSVFAIVLILMFRHHLFDQWQNELPANTPNRFVFDLIATDQPGFADMLKKNGIDVPFYPVIRGRLTHINGRVVQQAVSKEETEPEQSVNALQRDLALTEVDFLPPENRIETGKFYIRAPGGTDPVPVSVESELADKLSIELGDRLDFTIEGRGLEAEVASVRSVNWENFNPNFYMLFPDGALDGFSRTWLASFYLPSSNSSLDTELSKAFPSAGIINVDFVLERIQHILQQVSSAMELVFAMTVVAGVCVFWASLLVTFDEKRRLAALMRALGASRRQMRLRFMCEHLLIGLFAGLLCSLCLLPVSWLVSTQVLDMAWRAPVFYLIIPPLVLVAALALLGSRQLNRILDTPPMHVLGNA